jgi:hypothetical protein
MGFMASNCRRKKTTHIKVHGKTGNQNKQYTDNGKNTHIKVHVFQLYVNNNYIHKINYWIQQKI